MRNTRSQTNFSAKNGPFNNDAPLGTKQTAAQLEGSPTVYLTIKVCFLNTTILASVFENESFASLISRVSAPLNHT